MTPDDAEALRTVLHLADGRELLIRPVLPDDKDLLAAGFARMSAESRYLRFFSPIDHLSEALLRYLTEIDYVDHFAWVAGTEIDGHLVGVGVARYVRYKDGGDAAEAAVAVADDFHGLGIGRALLELLASSAIRNGIRHFHLLVRADNIPMIELTRSLGAESVRDADDDPGVTRFVLDVPELVGELAGSPMYDLFARIARGDATLGPDGYRMPAD